MCLRFCTCVCGFQAVEMIKNMSDVLWLNTFLARFGAHCSLFFSCEDVTPERFPEVISDCSLSFVGGVKMLIHTRSFKVSIVETEEKDIFQPVRVVCNPTCLNLIAEIEAEQFFWFCPCESGVSMLGSTPITWHEHSAQTFIPDPSVVYKLPLTDGKWGTIRSNATLIILLSGAVFTGRTFLNWKKTSSLLSSCHTEASQCLNRTSDWRQLLTKVNRFQVMQWRRPKQIVFCHKCRTIRFYFSEWDIKATTVCLQRKMPSKTKDSMAQKTHIVVFIVSIHVRTRNFN